MSRASANSRIRYLARPEDETQTAAAWIHSTEDVIARAFEIAYDAVHAHVNNDDVKARFIHANVRPFVRAAINTLFEPVNDIANELPRDDCEFHDSWVDRYFPDPDNLPPVPRTPRELDCDWPQFSDETVEDFRIRHAAHLTQTVVPIPIPIRPQTLEARGLTRDSWS
ncbi:hypothetical protein CC85DRAFT_287758 [Cutaneotrichosporon oleaginosum]|uniref:Uncharacterized protein n=1 Tax=Cutaneotrichosporon oleaginosum TaxID=879819 RepID=A0A0J1AY28_9TREE|nr:uncharacterized protein CC85DRAFT_287758 [Cutaneotrichosporon oleaginosum]KLT40234.1 hypothetical protein CC85DRAFT_287758 [Cutaneotrichosporon oleaginosum]TXT10476.1 hypothetical protein COLE_04410 [Cutaneotrichosporon oleaginosum]